MRRFPRLRAVAVGFALIGLYMAVLAGAASGPAHATTTGPPVFNNLPPISHTSCFAGQVQLQPCQVLLVPTDTSDTATFSTGITAHRYQSTVLVPVTCKPSLPGDPQLPIGPPAGTAAPVQLKTRFSPPPSGTYQYSCTATDSTQPAGSQSTTVTVSLTAMDQPTNKPATPGPQNATADTSDTATVTYPAVTSSEGSVKNEVGEAVLSCGISPLSNGATSDNQFVSGGTFPLGVTNLYCTASDTADGQPGAVPPNQFLKVTVADQPVTLTVPTYQLDPATSSSGATISYTTGPVTATENDATATEADTPFCSADKSAASSSDGFVSGGSFPVGGTTITCTAPVNDDPTNPGPYRGFTVIITNTPCLVLAGCNLHGLDLSNAILAGADLSSETDLSNANLNKANLSGASLSYANLSGANLNRVDLTGANLTGAITTGANFNMVTWSNTTCPDGTNSSASTPETCVGHL